MPDEDQKVIVLSDYVKKKKQKEREMAGPARLLLRLTVLFITASVLIFGIFMWQDYKRTTLFSHNPNEIFELLDSQDAKSLTPAVKEKISSMADEIKGLEYLAVFSDQQGAGKPNKQAPDYVFSTDGKNVKDTLGMGNGKWHIEYKFKEEKSKLVWNSFLVVFIFLSFALFISWIVIGFKYPAGMTMTSRMMYIK
ncbi:MULTISPECIES: hypothetical protein [Fictibacillus]|uniref:Uncharacterized protein n=1 Tax=Fictibacillus terranigra TaxID=3058424 RepID=A0ABT8ECA2_9BACL|nr:hypothetical protein [Fictibacillus sp. CENA-BCM004]MDN4075549.1 hypothetical protein [Fictibacillus sp. CENA-BCM004]